MYNVANLLKSIDDNGVMIVEQCVDYVRFGIVVKLNGPELWPAVVMQKVEIVRDRSEDTGAETEVVAQDEEGSNLAEHRWTRLGAPFLD